MTDTGHDAKAPAARDDRDGWLEIHGGRRLSFDRLGERLSAALREHGLGRTLWLAARAPFRHALSRLRYRIDGRIDRRYGTDTQGRIPLSALGFASPNKALGRPYEPSPERTFHRILAHLPRSLAGFTFIDYGCGKGRTLLYAASYDFAEILGVEFSPELAAIGTANAAKLAAKTGDRRLAMRCEDATGFVPPPTPLVCYFFTPFDTEALFEAVAHRLDESYRAHRRKIYVVLYNARRWAPVFAAQPFLHLMTQGRVAFDPGAPIRYDYAIFETRDD
jgi:SAM-dependent methyltransferase